MAPRVVQVERQVRKQPYCQRTWSSGGVLEPTAMMGLVEVSSSWQWDVFLYTSFPISGQQPGWPGSALWLGMCF